MQFYGQIINIEPTVSRELLIKSIFNALNNIITINW